MGEGRLGREGRARLAVSAVWQQGPNLALTTPSSGLLIVSVTGIHSGSDGRLCVRSPGRLVLRSNPRLCLCKACLRDQSPVIGRIQFGLRVCGLEPSVGPLHWGLPGQLTVSHLASPKYWTRERQRQRQKDRTTEKNKKRGRERDKKTDSKR